MNRNYIVLVVIAFALAIGMLVMDNTKHIRELDPAKLAIAYNDPSRFLSVDEVTDRLIKQDPGLVLVDVRPVDQYKTFSIPGAINIPVDSLLTPVAIDIFNKPELDKVIYSNSEVWSDQAWLLYTRLEMPNIFVLEGGVNNWFKSIVQGTEPNETSPSDEFDVYSFRMAANQYFYGSKKKKVIDKIIEKPKSQPVQRIVIERNEPEAGGGC